MLLRFIIGLGFVVALLVIGGLIAGGGMMASSLPTVEGTITVPGLSSSVSIERDEHGVPHIFASGEEDGYFALGFVHGQDRLFQMEMMRRIGEGRLSEISGERTVLIDAWARRIGFRRIANEMWKKTSPETRRNVTAYVKGINAYIKAADRKWGFEFDAANLQPSDWTPEQSLMIGRLMAWEMNFSYWTDAAFGDIALAIDSSKLPHLFPGYPAEGATVVEGASPQAITKTWKSLYAPVKINYDSIRKAAAAKKPTAAKPDSNAPIDRGVAVPPPPIGFKDETVQQFFAELRNLNARMDQVLGPRGIGGGSNAFAIAPQRSASGGALLENDMHLALSTPSRWHLAHLSAGSLNVAGFCVPGLPAFIAGRNESLSWGVTNTMADESDFFIETLDSTGRRYMTPRGAQNFVEFVDTILVKDSINGEMLKYPLTVRQTVHGPVMSDIHPFRIANLIFNDNKAGGVPRDTTFLGRRRIVSLTWNGLYAMGDELGSMMRMNKARSVNEARTALRDFATPCLNMCFAERSGRIAYQYIGRMPRRSGSEERILLPRDGMNPSHAWSGFITLAGLPATDNPSRGYIVSANNPATRNRTIPFSNQWEPAARAERIAQLIEQTAKHDTASLKRIALDVTSNYDWGVILPKLLALYPDPKPVRFDPDSSFKWLLDSMKLSWRRDSLRMRGNMNDSLFATIVRDDSIKLAKPWLARPTVIKQHALVERALEYLRNWNGSMNKEEVAPTIYSVFLQRLIENTFLDELGLERYRSFMYVNNVPLRTIAKLLDDSTNVWFDRVNTRGPMPETRDSIIKYSFVEALRILRNSLGNDLTQWQWGRLHSLTYEHMFASQDKRVAKLVNIESGPAPGSPTTVYQATYHMWNPYKMKVGPSMRMIADMKTNVLYAALPTGNSEAVFGDHYRDMLEMFNRGDFIEVPLSGRNPNWRKLELQPGE
jgi:acyl-homoserine lactone acylase PvdQ